MKKKYDCVIVGAGPAGLSCARILAQNGLSVLVAEQYKLPRNKACTGILSQKSINAVNKNYGDIPENLIVFPYDYKGSRYKVARGVPMMGEETPENEKALSVKRCDFDFWLATMAQKAGAEIVQECAFASILHKDDKSVSLKLLQQMEDGTRQYMEIETKYLVAADGLSSRLRRLLFPERTKYLKGFCRQDYYIGSSNLDPKYNHIFIYNEAMKDPIWYFVKDKYIVVGSKAYSAKVLEENRKKVLDYFTQNYDLNIESYAFSEICSETISYTMLKLKDKKGKLDFVYGCEDAPILFAGEAGEMSDVLNEGIWVAIESGEYVAEAIIDNATHNNDLLGTYRALSKDMISELSRNWEQYWKKFGSMAQ